MIAPSRCSGTAQLASEWVKSSKKLCDLLLAQLTLQQEVAQLASLSSQLSDSKPKPQHAVWHTAPQCQTQIALKHSAEREQLAVSTSSRPVARAVEVAQHLAVERLCVCV